MKEEMPMKPWLIVYDHPCLALHRLYGCVSAETPFSCLPAAAALASPAPDQPVIFLGIADSFPLPAGGYRIHVGREEGGNSAIHLTGDGDVNLLKQ